MQLYVQSLCISCITFSSLVEDFWHFPTPNFRLCPYSRSSFFLKDYNPVKTNTYSSLTKPEHFLLICIQIKKVFWLLLILLMKMVQIIFLENNTKNVFLNWIGKD